MALGSYDGSLRVRDLAIGTVLANPRSVRLAD
jgi:hypothetical protein